MKTETYFDVSNIFWSFIEALINDNSNDILYTEEYSYFSYAIAQKNKLILNCNEIWINDSDVDTLNFPQNSILNYDSYMGCYVFDKVHELFMCVESIYETVINTNMLDGERYNCVMAYQNRYNKIKRAIQNIKVKATMKRNFGTSGTSTNNLEDMFSSLKI